MLYLKWFNIDRSKKTLEIRYLAALYKVSSIILKESLRT